MESFNGIEASSASKANQAMAPWSRSVCPPGRRSAEHSNLSDDAPWPPLHEAETRTSFLMFADRGFAIRRSRGRAADRMHDRRRAACYAPTGLSAKHQGR